MSIFRTAAAAALILGSNWSLRADTLRVCPSGCSYSTIQSALNAARNGDIVEIEPGFVYLESLRFPAKHDVVVRSSRWRELPPLDQRIDPEAHAALLPVVRIPNRFSTALSMGQQESVVAQDGVDTNADTIRFESNFALGNDTGVSCTGQAMPVPLSPRVKYFLRDWNSTNRTAKIAVTPGGPAIDLLSAGSAGMSNYYARPRCTAWDSPKNWTFRGIRFEAMSNPGGDLGWLVNVGSNEQPSPDMGPDNIRFHQVVISGQPDGITGPSFCLVLAAGRGHEVVSSWIGHCKAVGGIESKAIWLQNVDNVEIRNNYISSASINILTAGGDAARMEVVRNIRIRGNLVEKPGYMMYREGTGAPSGECYYGGGSGAFYRRTEVTPNTCANGACYTCQQDNTWALDTNTFYRPGNFLTKNLIELKDCDGCSVEGNVFRGGYVGPDAGQGACASITAATGSGFGSGYHINYNVVFKNNWCDQVYGGLSAGNGVIDGPGFNQLPMRNIHIENNLVTNLGRFPALSQWPTAADVGVRNFSTGQGIDGLRFRNNTFRPAPGMTSKNAVTFGPGAWPAANLITGLDLRNNIFQFNGPANQCAMCISFPPAEAGGCTPGGFLRWVPDSTEKMVRNNLFSGGEYNRFNDFARDATCTSRMFQANEFTASVGDVQFVSESNHRLTPASPYSARNSNPILLDTEGRDLGADIDVLEMYTKPALEGRLPMPEQLKVSADVGVTQAVLRFSRPSESACSVRLYGGAARTPANLVADTASAELQSDSRSGNIVEGSEVQFLLGNVQTLSAGQRYQYHIDCGEIWAIGWLETHAAPDPDPNPDLVIEVSLPGDQGVVEYSGTPDFASSQNMPTVLPANGQLNLRWPPANAKRYVRYRILDAQGQPRKKSKVRIQVAR